MTPRHYAKSEILAGRHAEKVVAWFEAEGQPSLNWEVPL